MHRGLTGLAFHVARTGLAVLMTSVFLTGSATAVRAEQITVMTQNLYLGTDTGAVLNAQDFPTLLGALSTALSSIVANDFPARAGAIASEISNAGAPLLIGLQEAYIVSGPNVPQLDYAQILVGKLAEQGLNYAIVRSHTDAAFLAVTPFGTYSATDREVVIARTDVAGLVINSSSEYTFVNNYSAATLAGPLPFNRGYVSVDASLNGVPFEFISTHLDEFHQLNEAQAQEIIDQLADGTSLQLVVGDFNNTPSDPAYAAMVAAGFIDVAAAVGVLDPTFGQDAALSNALSALTDRIDFIFARNFDSLLSAIVVGDTPFQDIPPLWPSDHAGVVASVAPVPLPAALPLFAGGLGLLGWMARRRRGQAANA